MRKLVGSIAVAAIIWRLGEQGPSAQTGLTILSPPSGAKLAVGPDYATDVLGDPWDMSNPQDISVDPHETVGWGSNFGFSNGQVGGSTTAVKGSVDTSLAFLYRGFYNTPITGRSGRRYPIDTTRYKKLAYKMYSGTAGETPQAIWFHQPWDSPAGLGLGVRFLPKTAAGNKIYAADLTQSLAAGEAWASALVRGFRLDPNSNTYGQQVFFDWVRLTAGDANTTALQRISWSSGTGTTTIDVIDAAGAVFNVASGLSSTFYDWNYGVLPPGQYTLRITQGSSSASQPFSVNNPPLIKVTDPDETGGTDDYATTMLNNPWDMDNSASDVRATLSVTSPSYSGGRFNGFNSSADPIVFFVNNNATIDTKRYRYLTFNLQIDSPYDWAAGAVARVFWGSQASSTGATMTGTQDIIVWPGINSYTVDMASLSLGPDGAIENLGAKQLWSAANLRHLRIDPDEFPTVKGFHFGAVRLTAMDTASSSFTVRFAGSDADGDPATVSLYYDTNTNPADGKTLIASGVPLSGGQYNWNTAGVNPGIYYVYATVTDGLDIRGSYSTGPVQVNNPVLTGDPLMQIEKPVGGSTATQPFTLSGWAVDRDATSGTGVDQLAVYAQPSSGSPIYLGAPTYGLSRPDIGSAFGTQFTGSGYTMSVSGLAAGTYQLIVHAHSTVTGTFNNTQTVTVVIPLAIQSSLPKMSLEQPLNNATVARTFTVSGYAVDLGSTSGPGVDMVAIYAFPNPGSGAPGISLGLATYGSSRPDVAALYGSSRFTNSGYTRSISTLSPGVYNIVVYARSLITKTWNNVKTARVTVQ